MKNLTSLLILMGLFSLSLSKVYARSGCCSHHSGVCGCGCCDGTSLSSTCAPYYPECSRSIQTTAPLPTKIYIPTPTRTVAAILTKKITPNGTIAPTAPSLVVPTFTPTPTQTSTETSGGNEGGVILTLLALGGGIWYWKSKRKN